jgi:hypothetical protein
MSETESLDPRKAEMIATMLAGLAAQFHRDEINEAQAKMLFAQFAEDLDEFAIVDIDAGVKVYRRDPKNRFFPTSGQLREPIIHARGERITRERREAEAAREAARKPGGVESRSYVPRDRPSMWWTLPYWDLSWRLSQIPPEWRGVYEKRIALAQQQRPSAWPQMAFSHRKVSEAQAVTEDRN